MDCRLLRRAHRRGFSGHAAFALGYAPRPLGPPEREGAAEDSRKSIRPRKNRPAPESDLLNYLATRGSASVQVLRQKFSEAFLQALKEKWLVVDEVERERTQRQVYAVRLAGPVPEKPLRLSPVAKRILEVLGAEGTAGDHRELLQTARADLAALKKLSASGLIELEPSKAERRSALQAQEASCSGTNGPRRMHPLS